MPVGNLIKLTSEYLSPVAYTLHLSGEAINLNQLLGKNIRLKYSGVIHCIACGNKTKSSFAQGYCYSCFKTSPETEACILKPELCRAHLGEGRDLAWSEAHHLQPHFVYLAYSSNVKVGVTRETQVPTRWIDQGANKAIPFLKTPNRHIAGIAEVFLKQKFSDKTNWKKMLAPPELMQPDLKEHVEEALAFLPGELKKYSIEAPQFDFEYPILHFPENLSTVNLEKTPEISGVLVGIKGQYLMLKSGEVINVRKHNGFEIAFDWD